MRSVLWRDMHRVLSVPAPWLIFAIAAVAAVGSSVLLPALRVVPSGASVLAVLPILAGCCGALAVGADFRFGALPAELLLVGGRLAYVVRSLTAVAAVALAGAAAVAGAAVAVWVLMGEPVGVSTAAATVGAGALGGLCWAVAGAGLAVITRSQVVAVVALMLYLVLIEPMIETGVPRMAEALPARATAELLAAPAPPGLLREALALVAFALVMAAAAIAAFRRRDVPITAG